MLTLLKARGNDLLHFFFPHTCAGCGSDLVTKEEQICIACYTSLAETGFAAAPNNPIEKLFYGRLPLAAAMSSYYFTKHSVLQQLIHALKYSGNQEAGLQMGKWMGLQLQHSNRFQEIDYLVPMPLYADKLKRRGYNQATVLCNGIAAVTGTEVREDIVLRKRNTETQTKKGRNERWVNVKGSFEILQPEVVAGKRLLLVDDVVTTGASLEACGEVIKEASPATLSIATLAWASDD